MRHLMGYLRFTEQRFDEPRKLYLDTSRHKEYRSDIEVECPPPDTAAVVYLNTATMKLECEVLDYEL